MSTPAEVKACTEILQASENPVIVELGAYRGEECEWMRQAAPTARHIMVEPDPRNCVHILGRLRPGEELVQAAIWSGMDLLDFHLSSMTGPRAGETGSGSLRTPTAECRTAYPFLHFNATITVPCITLDWLFGKKDLDHIDLLWADLQGCERDMIAGGRFALEATRYLFMEDEGFQCYEGQASRAELLAMLPDWTLVGDFGCNILLKNEAFQ